MGILFIIYKK